MDLYVNRYRRFENAQSYGYDFLIPNATVWDNQVKQYINMFISERTQRKVSFLAQISNDYGKSFTAIGKITPDTQGKYDRNGRLNYWADVALTDKKPKPPFAIDISASMSWISAFLDKAERGEIPLQSDQSNLIAKKLASPTLLKLHNYTVFAENCLHVVSDYYLSKDKKLLFILDDNDYDESASAVCKAIYENAPFFKTVNYISYTNDITRLCNSGIFNLFCCPASEATSLPQYESYLVIDLVGCNQSQTKGHSMMKDILKCGLMGDFNLYIKEHQDDPSVKKLVRLNNTKALTALTYLYINDRGLLKLRPNEAIENDILKYISELA